MNDSQIPIDAKSSRLSDVLGGASFKIPDFQRPYSWGEEQIKDLWDDLLDSAVPSTPFPHFFGTLLTAPSNHPLEQSGLDVLDGQQRLTTFTLLLIALDRQLEELESPDAAKHVRDGAAASRKRIREALRTDKDARRLRLRADDDHILANLLTGNPATGSIGRAFARIQDHVETFLESSENRFEELRRLTDAVLDRSVVIHAHCRAGFDSFVVFSTLNATGLPLTASQILRARSLGLANKLSAAVVAETKDAWDTVEDLKDDGDRFLQAFLVLRTGTRVQVKDVVRTFDRVALMSRNLPSDQEAHFTDLAVELKHLAPIYRDLSDGKWPAGTMKPPTDWHEARIRLLVRSLGIKQLLPLLMAAAATPSIDFVKGLDALERAAFVALVCLDNQTRWGDRTFQIAADVYAKKVDSQGLLTSIQEFFAIQLLNPAERFAARLPEQVRYNGRRKTLIRYFLTAINDWGFPAIKPTPQPDIQATWVLGDIHIDHISAQKGKDTIPELERDRLGNLTPLKGKDNMSLSNKTFDEKRTAYAASPLRITRALGDVDAWDGARLAAREKAMVDFAAELFCRDLPPAIAPTPETEE